MIKLQLIFIIGSILVGTVTCQIVTTVDFTVSQGYQYPDIQKYEKKEWNNVLEFAIYGWIRPDYFYNQEVSIYRFSSNLEVFSSNKQDSFTNSMGDRVLSAIIKSGSIIFETYDSLNLTKLDPKVQHSSISFPSGNWIYIYQAYSPKSLKTFGYIKTPSSQISNYSLKSATHYKSSIYQLIAGPPTYNKNTVDILKIRTLSITWGTGAYKESNFDMNDDFLPLGPLQKCVNIYPECYFKGKPMEICDSISNATFPLIKSIYVPKGTIFQIRPTDPNYRGSPTQYTSSYYCFSELNFTKANIVITKSTFFSQIKPIHRSNKLSKNSRLH